MTRGRRRVPVANKQPASTAGFKVSCVARAAAPFARLAVWRPESVGSRTAAILPVLHHALSMLPACATEEAKISAKARRTTGYRVEAGKRESGRHDRGTRDGTARAFRQW